MNPVPIDDVEARTDKHDPTLEARHVASADGNAGPVVESDACPRSIPGHRMSGAVEGDVVGMDHDDAVMVLDEGGVCVDVQDAGSGRSWHLLITDGNGGMVGVYYDCR